MNWANYIIFAPAVLFALIIAYRSWRRRRGLMQRMNSLGVAQMKVEEHAWLFVLTAALTNKKERLRLRDRLESAGWSNADAVHMFMLSKLGLLLVAVVVGFFWQSIDIFHPFAKPMAIFKLLLLVYLAVRLPDLLLSERARLRRDRIRASVPQAVDLLTVCSQAGLSVEESFSRVAQEIVSSAPEVAAEFRRTSSELLVMPDRSQVFSSLGKRGDIPELEYLANALIQSTHFGTPLTEALQAIAMEGRHRQISALEEKAGKISARIGVPLIVLVLFPMVVVTAAPALLALAKTLLKAS